MGTLDQAPPLQPGQRADRRCKIASEASWEQMCPRGFRPSEQPVCSQPQRWKGSVLQPVEGCRFTAQKIPPMAAHWGFGRPANGAEMAGPAFQESSLGCHLSGMEPFSPRAAWEEPEMPSVAHSSDIRYFLPEHQAVEAAFSSAPLVGCDLRRVPPAL